ncbi:PEP/pyruvate-binding domain-containing protein [Rhodoplanes serenus]|uniref:PEP/pyruvate-binding domain-containing protein n=1 Tax=Rhodoplanes serenus TaxID=200615 RepID=UPI000DABD0B5|nr:PEP/pyruvate-binding domain-containing protein [Rhodoplanes serenus]RAI29658.1 pyruvate, phosphate dikinase [Rhodoplanes serenus]
MTIVRLGQGDTALAPETVGAKAANLDRLIRMGVPVPPAFVLPIAHCVAVLAGAPGAEAAMRDDLAAGIAWLEEATGRRFGDRRRPLLVSVRSGAARSMPGMLETVLDVGATTTATRGLVRATGNPRFAFDCRRRLLESYAETVLGVDRAPFAACRDELMRAEGVASERDLDGDAMERLVRAYEDVLGRADVTVPDDPATQLAAAALAVFRSWTSPRAVAYRGLEGLDALHGVAVTVQAMVFGNRSLRSGAGVAFSRDPSTGAAEPVIEMLIAAQGEDVVSGRRTPHGEAAFAAALPEAAARLGTLLGQLERAFGDVQDVEFTVEDGALWILQTRAAKRTPMAALRFAVDLAEGGVIDTAEALRRLADIDEAALIRTRLAEPGEPAARGIAAAGGVAVGRAAFDADSAVALAATGDPVILLRPDTSPSDVAGFAAAAGIVTAIGGRTAHAALVARQMAKPCVVGCAALVVSPGSGRATLGGAVLREGDWLAVDGDEGAVHLGTPRTVVERPPELDRIAAWRAGAGGLAVAGGIAPGSVARRA